jgi:hypothetical protein
MKYWFAMSFSLLLASLPLASVTDHREHVLQVFTRRRLDGSVFFLLWKNKINSTKRTIFLILSFGGDLLPETADGSAALRDRRVPGEEAHRNRGSSDDRDRCGIHRPDPRWARR